MNFSKIYFEKTSDLLDDLELFRVSFPLFSLSLMGKLEIKDVVMDKCLYILFYNKFGEIGFLKNQNPNLPPHFRICN